MQNKATNLWETRYEGKYCICNKLNWMKINFNWKWNFIKVVWQNTRIYF